MINYKHSEIAQSVEQVTVNHRVAGSSPVLGASISPALAGFFEIDSLKK